MNKIGKEYKSSQNYFLKYADENEQIIELSHDNVARVEAMIHFDSGFRRATNRISSSSSTFHILRLKEVLVDGKSVTNKEYKDIIENIVKKLNKENKTHLNADGCGEVLMIKKILKIDRDELKFLLMHPLESEYKLVKDLATKTKPNDDNLVGRCNLSFASKFCHYLCFYLFEGRKEQDNYSIYDSVVRKTLKLYIDYYGIQCKKLENDYVEYQRVIDLVIKKSGSGISRNGFDHLIWFCYK